MLSITAGNVLALDSLNHSLKIGVLAKRGHEICLQKWQPTAEYLTETIAEYTFEIVPLGFDELLPSVRNRDIDFMLANSAYYVMAEKEYFVHRVATLNNLRLGTSTTSFAGVLFTRADNPNIHSIHDLKGHTFAAVAPLSLGGWLAGRLELVQRGLMPEKDLDGISFLGTHDAVIHAVRNGDVAGGTVRSDALERMEAEGQIELSEFRILDQHHSQRCRVPFVHSTQDYPEWPMAILAHLDEKQANKVSVALLNMPADCPAAVASKSAGWHTPVSYRHVRENLKLQQIGPWADYGRIDFSQLIKDHLGFVIPGLMLSVLLMALTIKLNHSHMRLKKLSASQSETLQLHHQAKLDLQESNKRLERTLDQLHQEETRLVQSEKLATVGQVAAGVAHEINNPIGFIMSNLFTLQEYLEFNNKFTCANQNLSSAIQAGQKDDTNKYSQQIKEMLAEEDPEFVTEDSATLIRESLAGAMRVKEIVLNLKNMAQIGTAQWGPMDLNEGISAVHGVAQSNPDFTGGIHLDLEELPEFHGHPGEINQAILNLVTNAMQFSPNQEKITVSSRYGNETIHIEVNDQGPGISPEDHDKIFNPFFTTRPTGEGSGLGLCLARNIINRHGGSLNVSSTVGRGSSFIISLPVVPQKENAPAIL